MAISMYDRVRRDMLPGDVIAFGGKGAFSDVIKMRTNSPVSHVGVVLQTINARYPDAAFDTRWFNQVIESTSLNGFSGVSISRLSDRLRMYDGEVWWLPLADSVRRAFDPIAFFNFMFGQVGKRYDVWQAICSAIDWLPDTPEDFAEFFCSEFGSAGLVRANVLPDHNSSEVTPSNLVSFPIYAPRYTQLKGEKTLIPEYNRGALPRN